MAQSLGSLIVKFGLDAAEYTLGLTVAERDARRFAQALDRNISAAATVAAGSLALLTGAAGAAVAAVNILSRQVAHFQDIAETSGASASEIASFSVALQVSGKSADELGTFLVNLAKKMAGVKDATSTAGAALDALGLDIKKFKALDPASQIDALSKALAKFSDIGGGKAAATEAIAKGGAQLLPFLKELNEQGGRNVILTDQQIQQAKEYTDAQSRAKAELNAWAQGIATFAIPAITDLVKVSTEMLKQFFGIDKAANDLKSGKAVETWADNAARSVAFLADQVANVGKVFSTVGTLFAAASAANEASLKGEFDRAKRPMAAFVEDMNAMWSKETFSEKLERAIAARNVKPWSFFSMQQADKPEFKFNTPDKADRTAQTALTGQLRALDQAIQRERDVLRARESFLQDTFRDGLLSVQHYYDQLQAARNEELDHVVAFIDKKIEAERLFQSRAKTAQEREQAGVKIADFEEARAKAIRDAGFEGEKTARDRTRSNQEYLDQLEEINAKMLELEGNTRRAAEIRFDAQNRLFTARATATGDPASLQAVRNNAAIKEQLGLVADLGRAQQDYANKLDAVGIAAQRIDLLRSTGQLTEIEALNRRAELSRANVDNLNKEIDAYQKLADAIKDPQAREKAINDIARMRLAVDQLAASSAALAISINKGFADATADTIFKLTTGVESLSDAIKDFEKQLIAVISRIAAQNIGEALFKTGSTAGSGFDIGSIFAKLLSGTGGFSLPGFASGGDVLPHRAIAVGEHGTEIFIPKVAGTIVPNSALTSRRAARAGNTTVNVNVMPGATRASADQAASAMVRALQRAQNREA